YPATVFVYESANSQPEKRSPSRRRSVPPVETVPASDRDACGVDHSGQWTQSGCTEAYLSRDRRVHRAHVRPFHHGAAILPGGFFRIRSNVFSEHRADIRVRARREGPATPTGGEDRAAIL